MNWYWTDFPRGAVVGMVAGVIVGVTQFSLGTPLALAVVGGAIVLVIVAGLAPFVRRWKRGMRSGE